MIPWFSRTGLVIAALGALSLAGGGALAQPEAAAPATPPESQPPAPAPPPGLAPAPGPAPAPDAAAPAPAPATAAIEAEPLGAPDLFSAGAGRTGLPATLWRGSSADIAREVIPTLGTKPLSPAAMSLARRLLATGATAPDGAGQDVDLAATRLSALLALGDAAGVAAILERTPNQADSAALSRVAAEVALVLGRPDRACQIAETLQTGRDQAYWLRLRAYCLAHAGKTGEAELAFRLAGGSGAKDAYARLMGARLVEGAPAGEASARSGVELALSGDLKLDLAPAMAAAPPAILVAVAADPMASPAARLAASRAALRQDLIAPDLARMADPDALAEVAAAPDTPAKATALAAYLARAKSVAEFRAAARMAGPDLAALTPAEIPPETQIVLASAAAAAGDLPTARKIRDVIQRDTANPVLDLALLDAVLDAAQARVDIPVLDQLLERSGVGDAKARARAAAAAALLTALADPKASALGGRDRAELAKLDIGPAQASPARLMAMDIAADADLAGETGLLALAAATPGGAAGPRPADRAAIVRALARGGLRQDAGAFALEGLLELQGR